MAFRDYVMEALHFWLAAVISRSIFIHLYKFCKHGTNMLPRMYQTNSVFITYMRIPDRGHHLPAGLEQIPLLQDHGP